MITKLTGGHVDVPSDVVRCKLALAGIVSRLRAIVMSFGKVSMVEKSSLPRRKKLIIEAADNMIKAIEKWETELQDN